MVTVVLSMQLQLPGVRSLKEKRRILQSLFAGLRRDFNISIAEIAENDHPRSAFIGCAVITNSTAFGHQVIAKVVDKTQARPDLIVADYSVENR